MASAMASLLELEKCCLNNFLLAPNSIYRLIYQMCPDISEPTVEEAGEFFERESGGLKKEKAGYESAIAELNQRIAASEKQVADLTNLRDYCERVSDVIDEFGFDDKCLALDALDAKV